MPLLIISLAVCAQISSYVDAAGTTHYVNSPTEIPAKYRKKARPLEATLASPDPRPLTKEEAARAAAVEAQKPKGREQLVVEPTRTRPAPTPAPRARPSQQEERKRYDAMTKRRPTTTARGYFIEAPQALKPGESCHAWGTRCTYPTECCSNVCNPTSFTCD